MTQFLYGLVIDLQNKVQTLLQLAASNEIHKDLPDEYVSSIRNKLMQIQNKLKNIAANKKFLDAKLLFNNNFNIYRGLVEEVKLLELYHFPVILRYSDADIYFHKMGYWIYEQIASPLPPPVISATSNEYYWTDPKYNLVVLPVGEEHSLLNLPDLYHEFGHFFYAQYTPYLIGDFLSDLETHIENEKQRARDEDREHYLEKFEEIKFKWKENWIIEFTCDMIAVYLVGPAYGWANLRLSTNSLTDEFDVFTSGFSHPSDEARMRGIYEMLKQLGLKKEIENIDNKWQEYIKYITLSGSNHSLDYVYFYPNDLIAKLAQYVFEGCRNIGLIVFNKQIKSKNQTLSKILNDAWNKFLKEPEEFPDWEKAQLQIIRSELESI